MFIAEMDIPNTWTSLTANLNATDTFTIVNSSPDIVYAIEGNAVPDEALIGVPVQPGNFIKYKKGDNANLYLRNGYAPVMVGAVNTQPKTSRVIINKVG